MMLKKCFYCRREESRIGGTTWRSRFSKKKTRLSRSTGSQEAGLRSETARNYDSTVFFNSPLELSRLHNVGEAGGKLLRSEVAG